MMQNGLEGPRRGHLFRVLVLCVAALCAFVAVSGIWFTVSILPPRAHGTVSIDVQKGDTITQVITMLADKGLIKNEFAFRIYTRLFVPAPQIKAGHYILEKGTSVRNLLDELQSGKSSWESVVVTIPEGFTVKQIASRLQDAGVCTAKSFLSDEQHGTFDESFLKDIKQNKNIKYRLEGYLFPDTYDFTLHEDPREVIDDMLRNFARHIDTNAMNEMKSRGMTLWQTITEASLIEKEAKVAPERKIIASVINNRLAAKPPMKLQIDATIEYILGHQNIVTDADLRVKDPYNTYLYTGLPPGPIANPGMASIEAVLHPAKTNYFYYVVKNNGSGEHYFAHTYAEQLKNEAQSQKNLAAASH